MKEPPTDHRGCCSQPSRTGKAFTCLPNWVFGQTTANEKAVLLALQFHAPNIHPSLATLAVEAGLSQRTVQRVLVALETRGLLTKEETTTASGGKGANSYELRIWEKPTPASASGAVTHWPRWPGGYGQADQGAMATVANKQEQFSNKNKPLREEPPLPPAAQGELRPLAVAARPCRDGGQVGAAAEPQPGRDRDGLLIHPSQPPEQPAPMPQPASTQPQPQQPNAPRPLPEPPDPEAIAPVKPKARKREAGFTPTAEDVPAALLPVVRELLAFWPARNPRGKRTQGAWDRMMGQACKIQDHQQGGTEILRRQLEEGAEAIVSGPGWQGLDFKRWMLYGEKAGTPIIGTGFSGRRTTMDRVMGAIALVEERERRAAAQPAGRSELMLAGVR